MTTKLKKKKRSSPLGQSKAELPWRVTLRVRRTLLDVDMAPVVYYVRGKNPHAVCMMAAKLWEKWEKQDVGLASNPYPDVEECGFAECVDEHDFKSAYRDILKYTLAARVAGDITDPSAFTCLGRIDL